MRNLEWRIDRLEHRQFGDRWEASGASAAIVLNVIAFQAASADAPGGAVIVPRYGS